MRSGRMRHVVKIMRRSPTRTASGAQSTAYVEVGERFAEMEAVTGREFFASQQRGAEVTTKFTMRKYDGLIPAMRLQLGDRVFAIEAVLPAPVKDEMVVMAKELIGVNSP